MTIINPNCVECLKSLGDKIDVNTARKVALNMYNALSMHPPLSCEHQEKEKEHVLNFSDLHFPKDHISEKTGLRRKVALILPREFVGKLEYRIEVAVSSFMFDGFIVYHPPLDESYGAYGAISRKYRYTAAVYRQVQEDTAKDADVLFILNPLVDGLDYIGTHVGNIICRARVDGKIIWWMNEHQCDGYSCFCRSLQ